MQPRFHRENTMKKRGLSCLTAISTIKRHEKAKAQGTITKSNQICPNSSKSAQTVSFWLVLCHSVSFCLILRHSGSFCVILSHSVSFCLILSHSASFCVILSHPASFCLILRHSASFCFILSHSVSFCFILFDSVSFCLRFENDSQTIRKGVHRAPGRRK